MLLPSPCFTVGMLCSGWWAVLIFLPPMALPHVGPKNSALVWCEQSTFPMFFSVLYPSWQMGILMAFFQQSLFSWSSSLKARFVDCTDPEWPGDFWPLLWPVLCQWIEQYRLRSSKPLMFFTLENVTTFKLFHIFITDLSGEFFSIHDVAVHWCLLTNCWGLHRRSVMYEACGYWIRFHIIGLYYLIRWLLKEIDCTGLTLGVSEHRGLNIAIL